MLHHLMEIILPEIIYILEFMGVLVLIVAGFKAFYDYIMCMFKKCSLNYKYAFANSMATALEFKLGAEILKTVLITTFDDIYLLAAICFLRAIMSLIIHLEMNAISKHG